MTADTPMTQEQVEALADGPKYLIRKAGYYYRPNERGYTGSAITAGRYAEDQARKITHPNGPDGPRDQMSYHHEDSITDEDWLAFRQMRDDLARTCLATMTELEQVKGERRNIVSHATMGGTDGEGMSVNAISVKITALRNELYQEAKAQVTAAETALAAMTEREGVMRAALTDLLAAYAEPDMQICCNGHDCGCRGSTTRDMAEHYARAALQHKDTTHGPE